MSVPVLVEREEHHGMEDIDSLGQVIAFVIPSILVTVLSSVYMIGNTYLTAEVIGSEVLGCIIVILPLTNIVTSIAILFSSGSCSHIGYLIGIGDKVRASREMSTTLIVAIVVSVITAALCFFFVGPISVLLGAEGHVLEGAILYGKGFALTIPVFIMQYVLSQMLIVAGSPKRATIASLIGVMISLSADALILKVMGAGLMGSGLATLFGATFVSAVCAYYLYFCRDPILRPKMPLKDPRVIKDIYYRGSSQMFNNLIVALTNIIMLVITIHVISINAITGKAVSISIQTILFAIILGLNQGITPLIAYYNGKNDIERFRFMFRFGIVSSIIVGLITFLFIQTFLDDIARLFAQGSDVSVSKIQNSMTLISVSLLFSPFNITASSVFAAVSDSRTANIISALRGFVFYIPFILTLSLTLGPWGLDIAGICTEIATACFSIGFLLRRGYRHGFIANRYVP